MSTAKWDEFLVIIQDVAYGKSPGCSEEERQVAHLALTDAICCMAESISKSKECRSLLGPLVAGTTVLDGVKIPGTEHRVDPVKGAFDIGTAIRFLDHNDVLGGAEWGHPSGRRIPCKEAISMSIPKEQLILAIGSDNLGALLAISDYACRHREVFPRGSPITLATLLEALQKAYEIQGMVLIHNAFNAAGLDHVVLVKLASAAVVSWLMGLSEDQALAVLSHVFMDNVPLRVYRHGQNTTPRKGWAAGDACSRAVYLNLLVLNGQPGAHTVLSEPRWGFYDAIWQGKQFEMADDIPRGWAMRNLFFKLIAVEGHSISAIEACLQHVRQLRARYSKPEAYCAAIRRVRVRTSHAANTLINKVGPLRNAADRDHCMQYVLAVTLLKGSVPVAEDFFDDAAFQRTQLTERLRAKIFVDEVDEFTRAYHNLVVKSLPCAVTIEMEDGTVLDEILVEYPVGHTKNPATVPALREKFWRNMRLLYSDETIREVEDIVYRSPDTPVSELMDLLYCPQASVKL